MTLADVEAEAVEIWPENLAAVEVFSNLSTQWRVGMNGMTGLDYPAVEAVLRLRRIPRRAWEEIFDAVRVMEHAVLEKSAEKNG